MTRIVYLHGFASGPLSSKARYFRERLERRGARVQIPDLADGHFERLTLTGQLEVVERTVAGEPAVLIGSSMGGYLAALYAARHPEIERLVLMAPAFAFARRWRELLGAEKVAAWRREGAMDVFHYAENRTLRLGYALLEDAARYEEFPPFTQPALVFHGEKDDVVPVAFSRQFAGAHANARLEILDSGHELLNVLDYMGAEADAFLA
jgi:uncharacterized protein